MKHFDDIYDIASENYGIVTYAQAKEAGVTITELSRWTTSGRLERLGYGVYRLVRQPPSDLDMYAEACALVGKEAFIYGESALAMVDLALVNPKNITVASPKRVRKALPSWIEVVQAANVPQTVFEGIPTQRIADAIRTCRGAVMDERLVTAVDEARKRGLISSTEYAALKKEFEPHGNIAS